MLSDGTHFNFRFQLKVKAEKQDDQPHVLPGDGEQTETVPSLPVPPAVPDLPMASQDLTDEVEPMTG